MTLLKVENRLMVNLEIGFYNNKKKIFIYARMILVVLILSQDKKVFKNF